MEKTTCTDNLFEPQQELSFGDYLKLCAE